MNSPLLARYLCSFGPCCTNASMARVQNIAIGSLAQWVVKPLLAVAVANTVVPAMALPPAVATGMVLVSLPDWSAGSPMLEGA
jgi:ACR3 family arsenite efflux pump ArsB